MQRKINIKYFKTFKEVFDNLSAQLNRKPTYEEMKIKFYNVKDENRFKDCYEFIIQAKFNMLEDYKLKL